MTTSRTQPPSTDLIGRYLQAVGFWLPRAQKQDILAEISEDLRSQIEDRESDLGRAMTESEVSDLLKQRGRPILVAGQFLPQRSLIGPALYPIYVFVLKIVALCYVIPWLLVWFGILLFHRTEMGCPPFRRMAFAGHALDYRLHAVRHHYARLCRHRSRVDKDRPASPTGTRASFPS